MEKDKIKQFTSFEKLDRDLHKKGGLLRDIFFGRFDPTFGIWLDSEDCKKLIEEIKLIREEKRKS